MADDSKDNDTNDSCHCQMTNPNVHRVKKTVTVGLVQNHTYSETIKS